MEVLRDHRRMREAEGIRPEQGDCLERAPKPSPSGVAQSLEIAVLEERDEVVPFVERSILAVVCAQHALRGNARDVHRQGEPLLASNCVRLPNALEGGESVVVRAPLHARNLPCSGPRVPALR